MFVRWQKRARQWPKYGSHWNDDDTRRKDAHWAAILVESVRIDGKPRQRHVAYLGSIVESALTEETKCHRGYFWRDIKERLDRLDNRIPAKDRVAIEKKIAEKVPPISDGEFQDCLDAAPKLAKMWQKTIALASNLDDSGRARAKRVYGAAETAETCGECGEPIATAQQIWRRRIWIGRGFSGGVRKAVAPVCESCKFSEVDDRTSPCQGCARPVTMPYSIGQRVNIWVCSQRCWRVAYKKAKAKKKAASK